jgi:predicted ATPase/DNA-binding XRE family transcriptional regulator
VESRPRQSESHPRWVASLRDAANTAELAALLKKFRIQAGLSQQALAERALISVQAVSALERGYRKAPYHVTLERIANALALSQEAREALEHSAPRSRGPRLADHGTLTHNLPRKLTSLFGRDDVVREIADLLDTAPLVSIVGTGGIGKTRVAIEVGTRLVNRFPHGVWFVELAPLNDAALVPHAVARALHLQESTQRPTLETLFAYLAQKRLLIILDNCEHVISEARTIAGSLLRECPSVALLTTSREGLNITGEQIYRISPLAFPEQSVPSPDEASKYGAVALFANRVRAADLRFEVTAENVRSVVEICRRLDGLPLALELAAARAGVLSPQEIADRLDGVFDLLTGDQHGSISRHATMRAVIDWSYGLLSSQAQLLFDRLATFSGGFTLQTATTVCTDEAVRPQDILESLSSLVGQSLVMTNFVRGTTRYHLLETTRQYALEKLEERGERHTLGHRHTLALLEVAVRLDRDWYGASERSWFREAEAELDNFRAALTWSLEERSDLRSGCLLAGALARVWYSLSPIEGRRWVRLAIDSITEKTRADELAQLYIADAELCGALFESAASLASAEHALRLRPMLDDLQVARAEHAAGSALTAIGKDSEGEALLQRVLAAGERLENRRLQALALSDLGTACSRRGDVEGARRFYAEALALYVSLGLERPAASIAGHLAEVEFEAGDTAAALERAEEARTGHAATRNRRSEAADLSNMAAYLAALDCFDDARAYALQALEAARDVRAPVLSAFVLQHFAAIATLQSTSDHPLGKKREQVPMLLGFVEARLRSLGARRDYTERQEHERVVAVLKSAFGEQLDKLMALGSQWSDDAAATAALEL